MTAFFRILLMSFILLPSLTTPWLVHAQETASVDIIEEAANHDLPEYLWLRRPLVIFADNPSDPRYVEQMELVMRELADLADRDVVVLVDTDPAAATALRQKLRPRGFMLVLIDKDGGIRLRKPAPWTVREISRAIDKTEMRQEEIRRRRGGA